MVIAVVQKILDAIESSTSFNGFRQVIMHAQGKVTKTDEAIHQRNLYRAKMIREAKCKHGFLPSHHKPSPIEDEFAEFRKGEPE